jgi:hypothetical protein
MAAAPCEDRRPGRRQVLARTARGWRKCPAARRAPDWPASSARRLGKLCVDRAHCGVEPLGMLLAPSDNYRDMTGTSMGYVLRTANDFAPLSTAAENRLGRSFRDLVRHTRGRARPLGQSVAFLDPNVNANSLPSAAMASRSAIPAQSSGPARSSGATPIQHVTWPERGVPARA